MPAAVARRTRYDVPAWAQQFDLSSPAGWDAMHAHGEARKIESGTDPDTIDDPDVREHFLQLEQERYDRDAQSGDVVDDDSSGGGPGQRGRQGRPAAVSSPPTRLRTAFGRDAGGFFGRPDFDDASGLLLGLAAYAIVASALTSPTGAVDGMKAWFRAKFFNLPASGAGQLRTGQVRADSQDPAVLAGLLSPAITTTNATPKQPAPPANIAQILSFGLPIAAPTMPAPAGVAR